MSVDVKTHDTKLDLAKAVPSGYSSVELKELHIDNIDESVEYREVHFVMQDSAGNKRVCTVNMDKLDDHFRDAGWRIERDD